MIILDTKVVPELMRPSPDSRVATWFANLTDDSLATTTITVAEMTFGLARLPLGVKRSRLEKGFAELIDELGPLPVLDFISIAARLAGEARAAREASGFPIALADAAIAGLALAHGAGLATRNTRNFEGLGLRLINPWRD
jgi:predicted nucleic acid-binding protein